MHSIADWIKDIVGLDYAIQSKLLSSAIALILIWAIRSLILYIAGKNISDARSRYNWRKTTSYIAGAVAIIVVGRIWFVGFQTLSTFLGLLSAGIAIALRDPVVNIAGWAYILWWQPFEVGDRIEVGEHAGDVIDLDIMQFVVLETGNWVDADQSTGRIIHIPNGKVFTTALANYSKGFSYIWDEIPVLITFESNWKRAKEILQDIVNRESEETSKSAQKEIAHAAKKHLIVYNKLSPIVYTTVKDSGVALTLRYLTEHRQRRSKEQAIWEDILEEFAKCEDIDLAYPTVRYYDNAQES